MKKLLGLILFFCCLCPCEIFAQIQMDPLLEGAIIYQTEELKKVYDKRKNTQNELIVTQAGVTVIMERVHALESKVLEYMSNASAAMDNLYQLKHMAELVGDKIPSQMVKLGKAVPKNIAGTAVTTLTSKTLSSVAVEMVTLSTFMSDLVTNSKFTFKDQPNSGDKKNVNLLSAAERYYIANEVVSRLEKIYRKLWLLTWQVENLTWEDAWRNLDSQSYYQSQYGKQVANRLIQRWEKYAKFK